MFGPLFDTYAKSAPFCVMARLILEYLLRPTRLDTLFQKVAKTQYTRELLFSQLITLMSKVVFDIYPSIRSAYTARRHLLRVSDQAVYDKINHTELSLVAALVEDSGLQAQQLIQCLGASEKPWLPGYRCTILDGNRLTATERRLKPLQEEWIRGLPGLALVVLDQETRLVRQVLLDEDGHSSERSLFEQFYPLVQQKDLIIADRNFCTLDMMANIQQHNAFFVFRQHGSIKVQLQGERRLIGRTTTGMVYEQEIHVKHKKTTLQLRRITIVLDQPTRDKATEIHLLTNLSAEAADARVVAGLYQGRWGIEHLFLDMSQTMNAEPKNLAHPKAALLAFGLGLVASNAYQVMMSAVRAEHGPQVIENLSLYYMALEIEKVYQGMMIVLPESQWQAAQESSPEELAQQLRQIAQTIDLSRYPKAKRGPKKKFERKRYRNGQHRSTAKLLNQRRQRSKTAPEQPHRKTARRKTKRGKA
jgi:Transposase DDE domain